MNPNPIAIAISDLHLSLQQPACRADKDWMQVQAGYLKQVRDAANEIDIHKLPVLCSGDVFDRWNPPPELINFALEHLPDGMICVPGQHDLPNHRMEDMHRSGYGVLVQAKKIVDVAGRFTSGGYGFVYGFGWNQGVVPPGGESSYVLNIAIIHRYLYTADKSFPNAPESGNISNLKKEFSGYDVVISGDNHQSWVSKVGNCNVINPGGFIRRKSDERKHLPCMVVIYSDGSYKRKLLNIGEDLFHEDIEERSEVPIDIKAFINGLEKLGEHGLDFRQAVEQHLKNDEINETTAQIIRNALCQ